MGCEAVWAYRWVPAFRRIMRPPSWTPEIEAASSANRWDPPTSPHGIATQKTIMDVSNLLVKIRVYHTPWLHINTFPQKRSEHVRLEQASFCVKLWQTCTACHELSCPSRPIDSYFNEQRGVYDEFGTDTFRKNTVFLDSCVVVTRWTSCCVSLIASAWPEYRVVCKQ